MSQGYGCIKVYVSSGITYATTAKEKKQVQGT